MFGFGSKSSPDTGNEKGLAKIAPKLNGLLTPEQYDALPPSVRDEIEKPETMEVFATPEYQTSREEMFRFGNGIDLKQPGQRLVVLIPKGTDKRLLTLDLGHRKRERFWEVAASTGDTVKGHDPNGAYTEVLVFDGKTNKWIPFKDPKGFDPIKFAEPRSTIENEHMGCWPGMQGDVRPLAVMLISRGKDDSKKSVVTEHYLKLTTNPEITPDTEITERIYTPNTSFADYTKPKTQDALPKYGGGKDKYGYNGGKGGYPHAVPLRQKRGYEPFPMTENVNTATERLDEFGRLHIKLPEGKKFLSLEVSAGCKWTDGVPQGATSTIGVNGGHKLDAYLVSQDGSTDYFMKSLNVGPQGVLCSGPTQNGYVAKPGDEIVLCCPKGTVYVMGYRLIMEDSSKTPTLQVAAGTADTHKSVTSTLTQAQALPPVVAPVAATAAPKAVDPTAPAVVSASKAVVVPPEPVAPSVPPEALKKQPKVLNLVDTGQSAGGTQGGKWAIDQATKDRYLVKPYSHEADAVRRKDRCATEYIANNIYRRMGILAPESYMVGGSVVSKEIKGVQKYPSIGAHDSQKGPKAKAFFGSHPTLKEGFMVDAWLANWDVFGLEYDNVLKNPTTGECHRVDAGGALFFRGMGQSKPQFGNEAVSEIDTMRNPQMAREAGIIYQGFVTDADCKAQAAKLVQTMTDSVIASIVDASGISNAAQVKQTLMKRREWIKKKYSL